MVLDPTINGENMRFRPTYFIGLVLAHSLSIRLEKHIIHIFPNKKQSRICQCRYSANKTNMLSLVGMHLPENM
jgi:hypothetical protein